MLRLFCRCGYPLWVAARWTGTTIELFLLDGTREAERTQPPLEQCPHCRMTLRPDSLDGSARPSSSAAPSGADPQPLLSASTPPQLSVPHASHDGSQERSLVQRLLSRWGPPSASSKQQRTRRVLVVDDEQDIRETLQHWLESEGFQTASASDGVEALTFLQREPGNWLILLDLRMPRMDGWGVLHQLQADATVSGDYQIVLMSAEWLLAQEGPPWRSPQVVAAVPKPFDLDQVLAILIELTRA